MKACQATCCCCTNDVAIIELATNFWSSKISLFLEHQIFHMIKGEIVTRTFTKMCITLGRLSKTIFMKRVNTYGNPRPQQREGAWGRKTRQWTMDSSSFLQHRQEVSTWIPLWLKTFLVRMDLWQIRQMKNWMLAKIGNFQIHLDLSYWASLIPFCQERSQK